MRLFLWFGRLAAIAASLFLVSCGMPSMKSADFALADAAAVSTGKWTRADDGKASRPVYRSGNPPRVAQVSYVPGSTQAAHYESFVSSYLWVVERSGGKQHSRRTWAYRGFEVTQFLYDFGPGRANDERYVQVLFSRTPTPKYVIVRTMGRTTDPSSVQGADLMKALLDRAGTP
jgi:hypothetical protein